jgi:drug/metabolite transporter (DMT)-like permease
MLATVTLQPINQAVAKYLAPDLPVVEIVWGRLLFHCLFAVPFVVIHHGVGGLRPANSGIQIIRGGLFSVATLFLFGALAYIPMADAIALVFIAPLAVTALSPLLLGEHVGQRRWTAVAIGFAGALIVIRPGGGTVEWASLLALGSGVTYAFYQIITRQISGKAPQAVTLVYTALVGLVVMSAMLPFLWVAPTPLAWVWMAVAGAASALAHLCLIRAYHYAEASLIAPLSYAEIVMATLLGFLVFGDFPDVVTWLGVAVIASTGIYVSVGGRRG